MSCLSSNKKTFSEELLSIMRHLDTSKFRFPAKPYKMKSSRLKNFFLMIALADAATSFSMNKQESKKRILRIRT